MKVHMFSGSGFAWRVTFACQVKGVTYGEALMQPTRDNLKSPAFLQLSPRGKVPAIEVDGYSLPESMAILAYLDAKHPTPPLFGTTPEETGRIWQAVLDFDLYVSDAMVSNVIGLIAGGRGADSEDTLKEGAAVVHSELASLEDDLSDAGWIVGAGLTAADIAIFPLIEGLIRFTGKPEVRSFDLGFDQFGSRYPQLENWRRMIKELPAYEASYPAYWRQVDMAQSAMA